MWWLLVLLLLLLLLLRQASQAAVAPAATASSPATAQGERSPGWLTSPDSSCLGSRSHGGTSRGTMLSAV